LKPGSVVVDVGGGIGAKSLEIAAHNPQLKIVLQDLGPMVQAGEKVWRLLTT